ncbi:MAG TPA: hypothetical protein VKZ18_05200 [Polyangia bacterium]|nr:hypothetical protein [Polyangia bacterium]
MKVFSSIVLGGVLALGASAAKADPSPTPEMGGAQTMPSGAEPNSPPPATYDPGTPGTAPGTTPTTAPPAGTATPNTTDTTAAPGTSATTTPPAATTAPNTTDTATAPAPSPTDDMNAATPPAGTPANAPPPPAGNGATNIIVLPPPPTGQVTEGGVVAPMPPMPNAAEGAYPTYMVPTHVGVGLLVGGGFEDFVGSGIRNVTGDGGYWTARVVAGTREFVGVEAAYVGDARSISGLGLSSSSRLISNGLQGNFRVNIPIALRGPSSLLEPFGFIGLGWSHYQVTNNNAALSDFISRDDIMTLPYGGGLDYMYRGFFADARFTYTQTYFNNLTATTGGNLNNWGVGGMIGFEY